MADPGLHAVGSPGPETPNQPPRNGSEQRLRAIEQKMVAIESDIKHLATREDLQKMKNHMLMWVIGLLIATVAATSGLLMAVSRLSG